MFIDARKRLIAWEVKEFRRGVLEVWPVIRVSIERLILNETLGSVSVGTGSRYFDAFTKEKISRLIGINALPSVASDRSQVVFVLPERLANRGDQSWSPYFGWMRQALDDQQFSEYQVGNVKSSWELAKLLARDLLPALKAFALTLMHAGLIFEVLRVIKDTSVVWAFKGTVKVLLRLLCFKIYVYRFDRSIKFGAGQLVVTTAGKDVAMMALVSSANKAGADVAEVQHGLFYEGDFGYSPWGQFSKSSCLPNKYFAWNKADAEYVRTAFEINEDCVAVTGLLTAHPATVETMLCNDIDSARSDSCLLVLQPSQYMTSKEMSIIVSSVMIGRNRLDIRIHPDGRDSFYLQELKSHLSLELLNKTRIVESTEIAAHEHILLSGCVLGETSSMVLEAAHLGVPAALIGSVVNELATYSAIPESLIVSRDAKSITQFLKSRYFSLDVQNLPNKEKLKRSLNMMMKEVRE